MKKIEKIKFIKSFTDEEWLLNGWINEDPKTILSVFQVYTLFIKDGNYLELGCGSGILCKFLYQFSGKKIVPYGIDFNPKAIKMAKKNNADFTNNFTNENYYQTLNTNTYNFKRFSTINIFVSFGKNQYTKLSSSLPPIIKECKKTNFNIISYNYNFFTTKNKEIRKFISVMKKISSVFIASHSILVIGKGKEITQWRSNIIIPPSKK